MKQVVNFRTYLNGNNETATLDLIMTDLKKYFKKPQRLAPLGKSHHVAIHFQPTEETKSTVRAKTTILHRPLTTSGYVHICSLLKMETWEDVLNASNANIKYIIFHKIMHSYINKCFPIKQNTVYNNDKPWITPEIRNCIQKEHKLFVKRDPSWKCEQRKLRKFIKSAKLQFRSNMSAHIGEIGDRKWYKCVQKLLHNSSKSVLSQARLIEGFECKNDLEIANAINSHFASITDTETPLNRKNLSSFLPSTPSLLTISMESVFVRLKKLKIYKSTSPQSVPSAILRECAIELCYVLSHLLNSSFESGCVPDSWKQGYIAVIPKVNPVKSMNDLRPIAVTSNIAKIAEFFIHKELMMSITPHLSKLQFGVLPKKSTSHYLIRMLDFLLKSLDKKSTPAILTLLDCQKAFDMVDHNLIISRLIEMNVNGYVINWVTNFLSNRSNCVRIGKLMSSFIDLHFGVCSSNAYSNYHVQTWKYLGLLMMQQQQLLKQMGKTSLLQWSCRKLQ